MIQDEKKIKNLLFIILVTAAVLRLTGLTAFSLSNDELSALSRLQYDTLGKVISEGVYVDFHPAGVQVFLYFWTLIFGVGEWAVRLPFALMGVLSVYFLYRTGRIWFGTPAGLLAALSLAVLEYPLLYSQIARPYSPGLLFSLMATFFWTKFLFDDKPGKLKDGIGFVLSVSACMYIHYFSFLFAGILCVTGLFFIRKNTMLPYFLCGGAILLLYYPHLNVFLHQVSKGGIGGADGWLGPPGDGAFMKYIDYCFNDSPALKSIFFLIPAGTFIIYRGNFSFNRFHILSVVFFFLPYLVAYYYSIEVNPVFQHSVLLFSFPFLLLLLFSFIPSALRGFTFSLLFYCIMLAGVYSTVGENRYYTTQHFTEFRDLAKGIKQLDDKYGIEKITHAINIFNPYYIDYYLSNYDHKVNFAATQILSENEKKSFLEILDTSTTDYFMYAFSNTFDPPERDMIIRSNFPWLVFSDSLRGAGLRLYSKTRTPEILNRSPDLTFMLDFEDAQPDVEHYDTLRYSEGRQSYIVSRNEEYGPGLEIPLNKLAFFEGGKLEISVSALSDTVSLNAVLVCGIDKGDSSVSWQGADFQNYFRRKGEWFKVFQAIEFPGNLTGDEILKVYIWNREHMHFSIDELKVLYYSGL